MFKEMRTDIGLLLLRLIAGGFMLTHGYPKLVMLVSGAGAQFPNPIGLGGTFSLVLAVFSEFLCSLALVAGIKTRIVSIPLAITMFVAGFVVHFNDPWAKQEKALLFLGMYVVLIITGGGKLALIKEDA